MPSQRGGYDEFLKAKTKMTAPGNVQQKPLADAHRAVALNAAVGGAANFAKMAIQFLLLPIMAHLLGPTEFGIYAFALPTIAFFTVISDGGLGVSLAREDESATHVWSTAFWVLIATGIVLCLVVCGWGFVLAALAQRPSVSDLMAVLSVSFILIAVSVLPTARLIRSGNLVLFAAADFTATAVGAAVAISLAYLNAGAMSLAVQYVTTYAVRALFLNAVAFYKPTLQFEWRSLRGHLLTGGALLGGRLIEFSSRLVENLLFGRFFGAAALGTYTFANQVTRFICEAASNPTWSALYSHALRGNARDLGPVYRNLCRFLASLTFPVAALLSASAPPLLSLVLGAKWAPAAPLIQIIIPSYALLVVASQGTAILLSNGRNAAFITILAGLSVGRVLAVCSGYWLGITGVAWGLVITNVLYSVAMFIAPAPLMNARAVDLLRVLLAPTAASVTAGLVCFTALSFEPVGLMSMCAAILFGGIAFLTTMLLMEGSLLRADFAQLRRIMLRRPSLDEA